MRHHRSPALLRLASFTLVFACGAPAPSGADPELYAHDDPRFRVVVEREASEGLRARVEPRGAYHMATEFPFELALEAEGLALPQPRQRRAEARQISDEAVEFGVPLAKPTDTGRIRGRFVFGICQEDQICERIDHALAFALR